jgi:hypothetical protein
MNGGTAFRLAQVLGGKRAGARTFMARCPCKLHGNGLGDRTPSLKISERASGEIELRGLSLNAVSTTLCTPAGEET